MFWADRFAEEIIKSGKYKPYWVDDMKTPSGRVHIGALRGVVIHDLVYRALLQQGVKATYSYVINDMDPMDGFPEYLDKKFKKYMGFSLFKIPSPKKGYENFAQYYGQEFIETFNKIGSQPKILWSSKMYEQGDFNKVIKEVLDDQLKVRKLYKAISGYDKAKDWYPFQVICPKCGKVGTTQVYAWDGKEVSFECKKHLVTWAEGCGFRGKTSPFNGTGKLMWKADWAAHWKVMGITIEAAGKDHFSAGGSRDLSSALSEQVFHYPTPFGFLYEWFLAKGGRKMSSSKGIGVSAKEVSQTLPPEIIRFMLVRTNYKKAIDFDLENSNVAPNLFNDYDFCAQEYYKKGIKSDFGRIWQLSQIKEIPKKEPFLPVFLDVANYIQLPSVDIDEKFAEIKGSKLTKIEKEILEERIKYAKIWLENYAPKEVVYKVTKKIPNKVKSLSPDQKKYLKALIGLLEKDWKDPEKLQYQMYEAAKKLKIPPRKAFQAIYLVFIGKTHGPKAAWLLLEQDKKFLIKRLEGVLEYKCKKEVLVVEKRKTDKVAQFAVLNLKVSKKFPEMQFGVAVIKNTSVKKEDLKLEEFKKKTLHSLKDITTEEVNSLSTIRAYRNLFKAFGVDWHTRRPSPDALLRRIALGKGLYKINTLVDVYNLAVLQTKIGLGAFDLDRITLPVILRFAKKGESVILLSEKTPTLIKEGTLVYSDQERIITLDLNYRDCDYTKITLDSKNIILFADGAPGITRKEVEKGLDKGIELVTKFCGGEAEFKGVIK